MSQGRVVSIFIAAAAGAPTVSIDEATLVAGRGIVGDRYYDEVGTWSAKREGRLDHELTLIDAKEIDDFNASIGHNFGYGEFRRNIVTGGIDLDALVGSRFNVGAVLLEGIRLCEPCSHLAANVHGAVLPGLVHKGGLRAAILSGGTVRTGDDITA
jgi:MOSC domain-containing protein YiiM